MISRIGAKPIAAAIEAKLFWLAVIGIVASVISAFYYLRLIKVMYFDEPKLGLERHVPLFSQAVLLICALVTALFFLYPAPLLDAAAMAVGVFS